MPNIAQQVTRLCGAAIMALGIAATANAAGLTIKHAQGETAVPASPAKVLIFDLGTLDNLDRLGIKVSGVPSGISFPEYLKKYQSDDYAKIGTLFEPDYEAVNAAEPDLIIVAGRSAAKYGELSKLLPPSI